MMVMEPKEGQKDLHIITFVYCLFILYVSVTEIAEDKSVTWIEYYILGRLDWFIWVVKHILDMIA